MSIPTHTLTSIVIAQHVRNPLWAFVLALASHFLLDMIPHGDEELGAWAKAKDTISRGFFLLWMNFVIAAIFVLAIVVRTDLPHPVTLALAVLGGLLPDILWYVYDIYKLTIVKRFPRFRPLFQRFLKLEPFLEHHAKLHGWAHQLINRRISLRRGLVVELGVSLFFLYVGVKFAT